MTEDGHLETTRASAPAEDPSLVGGRYRIQRLLGRGGGGQVYLALDEHLGREVALKQVSGETDRELLLTRGLREARTSASLAHEHVVAVYDSFEAEGTPWIVMEYVPGPSLADLLQDGRSLPVTEVATIGAQVATALAAAHRGGILHRDVKPGNVLLTGQGERTNAKLTDFGIARAESDSQLTRTGLVSGTAAFFSPELARGEDPTPASDVWALGVTLYAAVEGRRPFEDAGNAVAMLHRIVREAPRPTTRAGALAPVLAGMLEPDEARRWTAAQAAQALTEIARGGTATATVGTPPSPFAAGPLGEPTQQVIPDRTASFPVAERSGRAAAGRPEPADPPERPRPAGARPAPARRPRRPLPWASLLLGAALLGLLIWAASHVLSGGTETGTASSSASRTHATKTTSATRTRTAQVAPVTAQEAVSVAQTFYTDLGEGRLDQARGLLGPNARVAGDITQGLTQLEWKSLQGKETADGTALVNLDAIYHYGSTVYTQHEQLVVGRTEAGGDPLILRRDTGDAEISTHGAAGAATGSTSVGGQGQQVTDQAHQAADKAAQKAADQARKAAEKAAKKNNGQGNG